MYGMNHSESQAEIIGTCPICDHELVLMDNKVKWHKCYPTEDQDITREYVNRQLTPHKLERMVEDILYVTQVSL